VDSVQRGLAGKNSMTDVKIQLDDVVPDVYRDLRSIASRALRKEPDDHSYQTTELVHEAYLRLAEIKQMRWKDRDHVLRTAIGVVRRVLIDYARARRSKKRDFNNLSTFPPSDQFSDSVESGFDLLELEEALQNLEAFDPRKAALVELKFFGGLDLEAIARILNVSKATVKRDWVFSKAWLTKALSEGTNHGK
jgi:RNA polymerase sigma-70 factor (ECF subfamily)